MCSMVEYRRCWAGEATLAPEVGLEMQGAHSASWCEPLLQVALNVNAMMMCALIHASILKSGPEYVSDAEEADFMSRCRQFAIR